MDLFDMMEGQALIARARSDAERRLRVSRSLWHIATDARTYAADDMTGVGAKLSGRRWNDLGVPIIYAAASRTLACLEDGRPP